MRFGLSFLRLDEIVGGLVRQLIAAVIAASVSHLPCSSSRRRPCQCSRIRRNAGQEHRCPVKQNTTAAVGLERQQYHGQINGAPKSFRRYAHSLAAVLFVVI
jgi:hypothetical protein